MICAETTTYIYIIIHMNDHILGLNHIAIISSDLEMSKTFYTKVLGFQLVGEVWRPSRESNILYLESYGVTLELFSFPSSPPRSSYPEAVGLRHIAFSTQKFDLLLSNFCDAGIEYEPVRQSEQTGQRITYVFDPDQLPIEIVEVMSRN